MRPQYRRLSLWFLLKKMAALRKQERRFKLRVKTIFLLPKSVKNVRFVTIRHRKTLP
jgi:hypothetical protein